MSLLKALCCQIMAALIIILFFRWLIDADDRLLVHGLLAAMLSTIMRQPLWWLPIHIVLWPAILWAQTLSLPANAYLLALTLMLSVFWGTFKGDVPLFLSSNAVATALAGIIQVERPNTLIELGAGIGSIVVPLAIRHPELRIIAIERAPLPWMILRWRCLRLHNVEVLRKNLWQCDLSPFGIAYAFLSPRVMERLAIKVAAEMAPGSLLLSSSFAIPHWQPETTLTLDDHRRTRLYCYRMSREIIDSVSL